MGGQLLPTPPPPAPSPVVRDAGCQMWLGLAPALLSATCQRECTEPLTHPQAACPPGTREGDMEKGKPAMCWPGPGPGACPPLSSPPKSSCRLSRGPGEGAREWSRQSLPGRGGWGASLDPTPSPPAGATACCCSAPGHGGVASRTVRTLPGPSCSTLENSEDGGPGGSQ